MFNGDQQPLQVVVFSSEGREHLLVATLSAIEKWKLDFSLSIFVIIDGPFNIPEIPIGEIELMLHHHSRLGYIGSIIKTLSYIHSEFFLWIEDDWDLSNIALPQIEHALSVMSSDPNLVQSRWPNSDQPNTGGEKISSQLSRSLIPFSGNPSLCRTASVRLLFEPDALKAQLDGRSGLGWEEAICEIMTQRKMQSAVFSSIENSGIKHLGYLDSTDRYWHYVDKFQNSPKKRNSKDIRAGIENINRISVFFRFFIAAVCTLGSIFISKRTAEIAFRFVQVSRQR